jgi:hypothetical protein
MARPPPEMSCWLFQWMENRRRFLYLTPGIAGVGIKNRGWGNGPDEERVRVRFDVFYWS